MKHAVEGIWRKGARRPGHWLLCVLVCGIIVPQGVTQAQTVNRGGIARPFTLHDFETKQPIPLSQFEGQIVVLDFFAYWCGPCRESSPDLERNVGQYYRDRGGNKAGIPVTVVPVNIEDGSPRATRDFVTELGLTNVAEDFSADGAFAQFEKGVIPLFVIINGASDATSHLPWEVLYSSSGYAGPSTFRRIIDAVERDLEAPPFVRIQPSGIELLAGETGELSVAAGGAGPLEYQWFLNGEAIPDATSETFQLVDATGMDDGTYHVVVSNSFGSAESDPTLVRVFEGTEVKRFAWNGGDLPIPDDDQSGIRALMEIPTTGTVVRVQVKVAISHSYSGDLYVSFEGADGRQLALAHNDFGNASRDLNIDLETSFWSGKPLLGLWWLYVSDWAAQDVGVLTSWEIIVTYIPETVTVDEARLRLRSPNGDFRWVVVPSPPPYPWEVYVATSIEGPWEESLPTSVWLDDTSAVVRLEDDGTSDQRFFYLRTKHAVRNHSCCYESPRL